MKSKLWNSILSIRSMPELSRLLPGKFFFLIIIILHPFFLIIPLIMDYKIIFIFSLIIFYYLDYLFFNGDYSDKKIFYAKIVQYDSKLSIFIKQIIILIFLYSNKMFDDNEAVVYILLILFNQFTITFCYGFLNANTKLIRLLPLSNTKHTKSKLIFYFNTIEKLKKTTLTLDLFFFLILILQLNTNYNIYNISPTLLFAVYFGFVFFTLISIFILQFFFLYQNRQLYNEIKKELFDFEPESILYYSGGTEALYQLKHWIHIFDKIEKKTVIIIRELPETSPHEVNEYSIKIPSSQLKIIYIQKMSFMDSLIPPTIRLVFYCGNPMINGQMLRILKPACHIFLNHGESDKNVNVYQFLSAYNKLWVAGKMAIDRINKSNLDIPSNRFTIVGRPQTEGVIMNSKKKSDNSYKTIFYAPTWEGMIPDSDYTSIHDMAIPIIKTIIDKHPEIRIIFKPHPFTGKREKALKNTLLIIKKLLKQDTKHIYSTDGSIYDFFNMSDLLISDISSVINDYLVSEKPIIVCNPMNLSEKEMHDEFLTTQATYIIDSNCYDLESLIEIALRNDPMSNIRKKVRKYSLGDFPDGVFNNFNKQVNIHYAEMIKKYPIIKNNAKD